MNCLIRDCWRYFTRLRFRPGPRLSVGRREDEDLETLADELVVAAGHGDAAVRGLTGSRAVVAVHRGDGGRLSGGRAGLRLGAVLSVDPGYSGHRVVLVGLRRGVGPLGAQTVVGDVQRCSDAGRLRLVERTGVHAEILGLLTGLLPPAQDQLLRPRFLRRSESIVQHLGQVVATDVAH